MSKDTKDRPCLRSVDRNLYTTGHVATRCNAAPRTVSKWIDTGILKGFRVPGGTDRRVRKEDLLAFCREYGYPFADLVDEFAIRVVLVCLPSTITRLLEDSLPKQAGYRLTPCSNAFHAARIAHTAGCDILIVDSSVGRLTAEDMLGQMPASIHTGEQPLSIWVHGDDGSALESFDYSFGNDDAVGIAGAVRTEANRLIRYGLTTNPNS